MILSEEERLEEWNSQIANRYILNNVLLIIYLIIGVFGNLLVIIIYKFKMCTNKDDRYFISWLAVLDLFTTALRSSFELTKNRFPVKLNGTNFCKIVWIIIDIFAFSSMILLLVIAFHRYLKVCRPLGKQMTLPWKRVSLFVTFIVSITAAASLNSYNSEIGIQNQELNVTGYTCDIFVDNDMGVGFYILIFFMSILALLIITFLIVFYILIGRTIYNQIRVRQNRHAISREVHNQRGTLNGASTAQCLKMSHKFSYMFMAIAVGFCVSYVPQFVILFWQIKDGNFLFDDYEMSRQTITGTPLLSLLRETTIINHIINPFIYGFYDTAFRKEVKRSFLCRR